MLALCLVAPGFCIETENNDGQQIFREQCATCHGQDGQGKADAYEDPLFGDESITALARVIELTMPEEDPEACVGEDARQVANFIFHEFYSPAARIRKGLVPPPRIELGRLTVQQHRNAVADLLGAFTPAASGRDEVLPGFQADYYQSKGMSKADQRKQKRVDSRIDQDFGEGSPSADISPDQFAIVWEGALLADDTGHYEFRVTTGNGARLYLNNDQTGSRRRLRDDSSVAGQAALIDAWVSSGQVREETARMFLLGGRKYPLRLEFFKYKEKTASIKLEWKPPHGVWSVLDHEHVVTSKAARTFVLETPFPADDRSLGYERGSSISNAWHEAVIAAAIATADEVVARLPLLAGFEQGDAGRAEPAKELIAKLARTAFRRPLSSDEADLFGNRLFGDASPEAAVRQAVILMLTSPHFLYTDLSPTDAHPSQYAIASRVAFCLGDTLPDPPLLEAAERGELATNEQIQAHAQRMLTSPPARAKVRSFFHHWLELQERDFAKDQEMFPEFDEAVVADLRQSLERFVEEVVWSPESDYRQLLLADHLLLNERLRKLYAPRSEAWAAQNDGTDPSRSERKTTEASQHIRSLISDFEPVPFPLGRRAGVLTHPYLLSAFAYHNNSSPIHRGVFLTRNIIGRRLKPPPVAVAFKNEEFPPDLTMREKITQLTRDQACMSCHEVINPLGFALENFDAVGRWRVEENDRRVETRSQYVTSEGRTLEVENAVDIAKFAVKSPSAHRAFITQMFHHLVKQSPLAYGPDVVETLRLGFVADDFNMQNLIIRIAALAAMPEPDKTKELAFQP